MFEKSNSVRKQMKRKRLLESNYFIRNMKVMQLKLGVHQSGHKNHPISQSKLESKNVSGSKK